MICAPLCLTTVTSNSLPSAICPSPQDSALCGFIAATNIGNISTHTMWSCNSSGITSSNPCDSPLWTGLVCDGMSIISLTLASIGLTGISILYSHSYSYTFILALSVFDCTDVYELKSYF